MKMNTEVTLKNRPNLFKKGLGFLLFAFLILGYSIPTHAACPTDPDPISGLVAWWPLNEGSGTTANDCSGNSTPNTGSLVGGSQWNTSGLLYNNALSFNGSTFVQTTPNVITTNTALSVCAWINPANVTTQQAIIDNNAFELWTNSNGSLIAYFNGNNSVGSAAGTLTTGWQHVCTTFSGATGTVNFYIDGQPSGSGSTTFTQLSSSAYAANIGAYRGNGGFYFNGIIEDLRVYNIVLAASQVKSLFNSEAATLSLATPILTASAVGTTQVSLSWTGQPSFLSVTGYKIYRSTDNQNFSLVNTSGPTTTNYADTGLTAGTIYYYYVQAYNSQSTPAKTAQSATAQATTPTPSQMTITAASCQENDVSTAIGSALAGGTVVIPSCPSGVSWTSTLNITKPITLIGQGPGNTVIIDATSKGDATANTCNGSIPLIYLDLTSDVFVRISGFTLMDSRFDNGTQSPVPNCGESSSHIGVAGVSHQIRIDHITFYPIVVSININDDTWGVADHNTFIMPNNENPPFATAIHHNAWQGIGTWGDNSWAQPDTFGQAGAFYMENNSYTYPSSPTTDFPTGCFDAEGGGRLVFRFNTGCPFVGVHGLDSGGRMRSVRSYEIYNNAFSSVDNAVATEMYAAIFLRGGTGMIFNNSFTDVSPSFYGGFVDVTSYRSTSNDWGPWGINYSATGCDGRGPFDNNTGTVYATGAYNGSGATTEVMQDTTKNWTPNQWVGYSLVNLNATLNGYSTWGSVIVSNTANTITTTAAAQGSSHVWNTGDQYEILQTNACVDQVGRGEGKLIEDTSNGSGLPILASTGAIGPVNQVSDPLYAWLNTHNSNLTQVISSSEPSVIAANRDYYDWANSFNGSSGTGSGTLANAPKPCTPGVGYWATDEGQWNQSGNGAGQGALYVCSSSGTWSLYYTPYTYPHPLITSSSSSSSSCQYGCVSSDSSPSVYDAELVAQASVGLVTLTSAQQLEAEVDGNKTVDIYDAFLIAEYAVGLISQFPA